MDGDGRGDRRRLPLAHRRPRRTRRGPTSPTPPSRRPTTCWCRWPRPAPTTARSRCARTGSWTAWSPRRRSRSRNSRPGGIGITAPPTRLSDQYATDRPPAPDQRRRTTEETTNVAVEVRIPTILRTYTQGEKAVQGDGSHARAGDRRRRGPLPGSEGTAGGRVGGCVASSTCTSTTRTSGSPVASRPRPPTVTSWSCCRPSPAADRSPPGTAHSVRYDSLADSVGHTPLVGLPAALTGRGAYGCGPSSRTATPPAPSRTGRR